MLNVYRATYSLAIIIITMAKVGVCLYVCVFVELYVIPSDSANSKHRFRIPEHKLTPLAYSQKRTFSSFIPLRAIDLRTVKKTKYTILPKTMATRMASN